MTDRIPSPYPEEEPAEPRRAREDEEEENAPDREHETEDEPVAIP